MPLIPRYFDLLVLLVERRREAVHRREIFERVWGDVVVSESALSQAVRTIRRTLGDDPREPRFIRTVSRHGYQFVLDVIEEEDDTGSAAAVASAVSPIYGVAPAIEQAGASRHAALDDGESTRGFRWSDAALGGAVAGVAAGGVGGLILAAAPGSIAPIAIAPVLAVIGGVCGALGGGGVGAGLSFAEAQARAHRSIALIGAAALGGALAGGSVQLLARWGLAALLGLDVPVGGGLEGLAIGGAAGAGYAFAHRGAQEERAIAPGNRVSTPLIIALLCGTAGLVLTLAGYPLVAGTIHMIADAAEGSRATLAPLGRLIGEPDLGPVSSAILAFAEAATFGLGLGWGLNRRSS